MRGTWEEFKSNFDVGKSGRCREGTDGSLRSFDRELKARSRQFSDATSIVTMGGGTLSSLSLSIFLFLFPFLLFFSLALPLDSPDSLWHEPGYLSAIPSLLHLLILLLLPLSFSARVHPPVFLFHPPGGALAPLSARPPYFPVFCGRFVNLSAAFIGAADVKGRAYQ